MALALQIQNGPLKGMSFPIREGKAVTIGRDASNTIRLDDRKLSRIHCQVEVVGGHCQLTDLNSTNGTRVNGQRTGEAWLKTNDVVEVGTTSIQLVEISDEDLLAQGLPQAVKEPAPGEARCEECGVEIPQADLAAGLAKSVGSRRYCRRCSGIPVEEQEVEEFSDEETPVPGLGDRIESGKSIAGVRIISFLGEGRLGPLYEGEQISMGRLVALKMLKVQDREWARRYLDAVYASGKLVHPNIALIFDAGEVEGTHYVIREYVEGESVEDRLAAHVPVSLADAYSITTQVAYALEYASERRVFHGALSPRKVLLGPNSAVKVTGFGLPLTAPSGQAMGAVSWYGLPYTAPERLRGERTVDFASDVYSVVAVFYHLLAGNPPFRGTNRERVERSILSETPKPLTELNPTLPAIAQRIVDRGLSKDPRARYQLPREFLYDLEENLRKEL